LRASGISGAAIIASRIAGVVFAAQSSEAKHGFIR